VAVRRRALAVLALTPLLAVLAQGQGTASAATAPTVTLGPSNGAATVSGQTLLSSDSRLYVRGAHLSRAVDPASDHSDSISPVSSTSFQPYNIVIATNAPKIDVKFRGTSGHWRVWVDGVPQTMKTAPTNGAFYHATITFPTRATRNVRFEADLSRFVSLSVAKGDVVGTAKPAATRAIVVGDSFTEGTGATAKFTAFPSTLCRIEGWTDCWQSGSGGTGYLAPGAVSGRTGYGGRLSNDVLKWHPDVVVVTGGRNDNYRYTPAQVQAAATDVFRRVRAQVPDARLVVTSPFPSSKAEATNASLIAIGNAIHAAADSVGAQYVDVMGPSSYIIGSTGLVASDGVHPNQAGHDRLGSVLASKI
jgi:lysophospholipase L1-like esterase